MRTLSVILIGGVAVLALIAGASAFETWDVSRPRPSVIDVVECNQYADWIAARETSPADGETNDAADERLRHGALLNTGTLEGLAERNQEDAHAADAYRRCMVRRGYKAWG